VSPRSTFERLVHTLLQWAVAGKRQRRTTPAAGWVRGLRVAVRSELAALRASGDPGEVAVPSRTDAESRRSQASGSGRSQSPMSDGGDYS